MVTSRHFNVLPGPLLNVYKHTPTGTNEGLVLLVNVRTYTYQAFLTMIGQPKLHIADSVCLVTKDKLIWLVPCNAMWYGVIDKN